MKFDPTCFKQDNSSVLYLSRKHDKALFLQSWISIVQDSIESVNVLAFDHNFYRFWTQPGRFKTVVPRVFGRLPSSTKTLVNSLQMDAKRSVIVLDDSFNQISEALSFFLRAHYNKFQEMELRESELLIPDLLLLIFQYSQYSDTVESVIETLVLEEPVEHGRLVVEESLEQLVTSHSKKLPHLVLCAHDLQISMRLIRTSCEKLFRFLVLGGGLKGAEIRDIYEVWMSKQAVYDRQTVESLYIQYTRSPFVHLIFDLQTKQLYWYDADCILFKPENKKKNELLKSQ